MNVKDREKLAQNVTRDFIIMFDKWIDAIIRDNKDLSDEEINKIMVIAGTQFSSYIIKCCFPPDKRAHALACYTLNMVDEVELE